MIRRKGYSGSSKDEGCRCFRGCVKGGYGRQEGAIQYVTSNEMNDLQRTESEKKEAFEQLHKLKSSVETSKKQQHETQEGSTGKSPSLLVSGLLDMVAK